MYNISECLHILKSKNLNRDLKQNGRGDKSLLLGENDKGLKKQAFGKKCSQDTLVKISILR